MSVDRYERPFIDTSVFLAAINGESEPADGTTRGQVAKMIFAAAERKEITLVASALVAAEIIYKKGSPVLPTDTEPAIDQILNNKDRPILWVEIDYSLAVQARKLARMHRLEAPDAIHLASAIRANADVLLRWDRRFKDVDQVENIEIVDPFWYGERGLFDDLPEP